MVILRIKRKRYHLSRIQLSKDFKEIYHVEYDPKLLLAGIGPVCLKYVGSVVEFEMPTDEDRRERVYKQGDDNSRNMNGIGTRENRLKLWKSRNEIELEEDTHSGSESWRLW